MRRIISAALGGPLVLGLIAVTAWFLMGDGDGGAQAQGGSGLDPNVVGIDAITTGNTATSLGAIDYCVEVGGVGSTFDIDVFLNDVPASAGVDCDGDTVDDMTGHNLGGQSYNLIYDNSKLRVNSTDHNWLIVVKGAVLDIGDCSALGSPCPDVDGSLYVSVGGTAGAEANACFAAEPAGSLGVLSRLTLEVVSGGGTFVYLTLRDLGLGGFEWDPVAGMPAVIPWADEIEQVWDANFRPQYGVIAIAPASCAAVPSPTPTLTPTPEPPPTTSPTATSEPSPTASPTATPTPPTPAVAWMYSCYLGPSQPTEDALAAISGDVLAAYRLRPDQGYDRWFPGRPTVSTMTELNPYDALFLLVASDATWPQQPSGEPPSDANLVFGWNSVCYAGTAKDVQVATAGIAGQFSLAYTLAADQTWRRFVPGRPEVSNLTWLEPLTSLLILITDESGALWVFDP